jgi:polyphosphate:AMP phosphotransferase
VLGIAKKGVFESELDEIIRFEKMLVDEGAVVLKFWMHLSKDAQKKRLKSLEKNPKTRWRVTKEDWKRFKFYNQFRKVSEVALRQTSAGQCPWYVVEGQDPFYRSLTVAKTILEVVGDKVEDLKENKKSKVKSTTKKASILPAVDRKNIIDDLDLSKHLSKDEYKKQLEKYQGRLNLLSRDPRFKKISVIALFEGNDAAGKGGSIRRVTSALDARSYQVIPIAAPTQEELAQPYLWRFWRHVPRIGRVTIFDRSWYGRVLVERVEGYCSESDWMRAYTEINDFENQLATKNIVLVKFWLTVSEEEQLKRFKEREKISFKKFKITEDDWRNREKWGDYKDAVCDMVDRTSTDHCPWNLIESNDKYYGRIKTLKILCKTIEEALEKV